MAEADLGTLPGARAQLLDTASAIMREGDVADISLSELSLRSGLNSALVKYYFGNKAGLLKALLDRDWQAIVTSVDALVAKDGWDPEAKLRRHISKVVDTFYAVPYLNRLTMRLVGESDEAEARRIGTAVVLRAEKQRLERRLARTMEVGSARSQCDQLQADLAAEARGRREWAGYIV